MKVLCIDDGGAYDSNSSRPDSKFRPIKGEVYNSLYVGPLPTTLHIWPKIINAWHKLEEGKLGDLFHVSMFVELPPDVTFSKKKEEVKELVVSKS